MGKGLAASSESLWRGQRRKKETEVCLVFAISSAYAVVCADDFRFIIGSDVGAEEGDRKGAEKGGQKAKEGRE